MVTPELRNYIQEQIKLGASPETIKSTLTQSGWQEADVNEALDGAKPLSDVQAPVKISPAGRPEGPGPAVAGVAAGPQETPAVLSRDNPKRVFPASDIFQPKSEPVFQPKSFAAAPAIIKTGKSESGMNYKKFILPGILGLIAVVLVVVSGWLYAQTSSLNSKISSDESSISSLTQQVSSLTGDKNNLSNQVSSLNHTVGDLESSLSFFVVSPGVSSTTELAVNLKGILAGGGKKLYTVTTDKGVVVYVKNSDDKHVVSALKDLVGQEVQIGGSHAPGSDHVTVSAVNGSDISAPASSTSSTSSTATSTAK